MCDQVFCVPDQDWFALEVEDLVVASMNVVLVAFSQSFQFRFGYVQILVIHCVLTRRCEG